MKKVTDLKENEVILVRTEEEDLAIRTLMHEAGLKWYSGDSYLELSGILLGEGKYYEPNEGMNGSIGAAKSNGYTIYPASDFLEPNLESIAEQLKKLAESKGMKAEIVLGKIDIWEEAEFCKHVSGKHYKIDRIENQYIFTSDGSVLIDANCEPVSEEIVNWLKKEFEYRGVHICQDGKWAERVDECKKVEVEWDSIDDRKICFRYKGDVNLIQKMPEIAKKLEKYLNDGE